MSNIKPYLPKSKAFRLDVSTPINMAFEIQKALSEITRNHGDIDEFVTQRLKYDSVEAMHKALAAEQVDVVAMAIHQIEKGNAVINGDQTGIGKGRTAAAVIRYSILNGYNTVFVTEKSSLFSDLYRDLKDIDFDRATPLIFNGDKDANIVDEDGNLYYKMAGREKFKKKTTDQLNVLLDRGNELPDGYDFICTTYSQVVNDNISGKKKADDAKKKYKQKTSSQTKTEFLRRFSKNAIYIMDESHNAGGAKSTIGFYFREMLKKSRGAFFLSATFAKRPDNMPLYATRTSIQESGISDDDMIKIFEYGGVALQEITASELVKSGQMMRRQRTFEGIKVSWEYMEDELQDHWLIFDRLTDVIRDIVSFQKLYVKPFIEDLNNYMYSNVTADDLKGVKNFGADNHDYFSKLHNVISQMLFSIKAESVAKRAIELLNQDKKIVIAFSSTMGSFLAESGYGFGDIISNVDFAQVLQKGLDGVLRYTTKNEKNKVTKHTIGVEDLDGAGQIEFKRISQKIIDTVSDISMSPIDVLINTIEATKRPNNIGGNPSKYYRVRECTGRNARIGNVGGLNVLEKFKSDKNTFFREFNNGDADVLLINQSASTGVSAHASEKYKDQRQRVMIIHQPELNISTEVQKRGRINRTGQIEVLNGKPNLPEYIYLSSMIPCEQRQFMVLKNKLKSLDANTTGNNENSKEQLDAKDFFNKYGGKVIFDFIEKNSKIRWALNNPCYRLDKKATEEAGVDVWIPIPNDEIPKRVTNRVQLLPVEDQKIFYDTVIEKYDALVADLKRKGEYDLETEYLDYKADLEKLYLFVEGDSKASTFGRDAYLEQNKTRILRKPYKWSQIEEMLTKQLDGRTPEEIQQKMIQSVEDGFTQHLDSTLFWMDDRISKLREKRDAEVIKVAAYPQPHKDRTEKQNAARKQRIEKGEKRINNINSLIGAENDERHNRDLFMRSDNKSTLELLRFFKIGKIVKVPLGNEDNIILVDGIVLGISASYTSVRVDVAITHVWKGFNASFRESKVMFEKSRLITPQDELRVKENWNRLASVDAFQTSFIVTGNIFSGLNRNLNSLSGWKSKLIRFSTADGAFKNGLEFYNTSRVERDILRVKEKYPVLFKADVSLAKLADVFEDAPIGFEKRTTAGLLLQKKLYDDYRLILQPKGNKDIFSDPKILRMISPSNEQLVLGVTVGKFTQQTAGLLGATFTFEKFKRLLKILSEKYDQKILGNKVQELPIELAKEGEELEEIYKYKLSKKYAHKNYPKDRFVAHIKPDFEAKHGYVTYSKKLSSVDKFKHGLIPIFESIEQPYRAWVQKLSEDQQKKVSEAITLAKTQDYEIAIQQLGLLIFSNANAPANIEFELGEYTLLEFGEKLYRDRIGGKIEQVDPLEKLQLYLEMMKLELNHIKQQRQKKRAA